MDIVEEFAIAALELAAVGDVLQHVDGAQIVFREAAQARRGNQIGALVRGLHVFLDAGLHIAAERAGASDAFGGQRAQGFHVAAD